MRATPCGWPARHPLRVACPPPRRWPARHRVAGLPATASLACPPRRWPASRSHGLPL